MFRAGAPDSTHPASRASRVYDFTNLDRERGREELKFWLHGKQLKTVSADIVVERSSRVLAFRDHNPEKPPSYILEVKIVSARLIDKIPLTQDALAEFVAETDNHAVSHVTKSAGLLLRLLIFYGVLDSYAGIENSIQRAENCARIPF